jgi:hypothetical protein
MAENKNSTNSIKWNFGFLKERKDKKYRKQGECYGGSGYH